MIREFFRKLLRWIRGKDYEEVEEVKDSSFYPIESNTEKMLKEKLEDQRRENAYLRDEINTKESYEETTYHCPVTKKESVARTKSPYRESHHNANSKRSVMERNHYVYRDDDYYYDNSESIVDEIIQAEVIDDITDSNLGTDIFVADTFFGDGNIVSDILETEVFVDVVEDIFDCGGDSWDSGWDDSSW